MTATPTPPTTRSFSHSLLHFIDSHLVVVLSGIALLLGWILFDISPLHPLQEIARKQRSEEYKARMVTRHLTLANALLNVNQVAAAKSEFQQALQLDPSSVYAQLGLFKTEVFQPITEGNYDPELARSRIILIQQEDSTDAHVQLYLAQVYSQSDFADSALYYYGKALAKDSSIAAAYYGIGDVYIKRGDREKALLSLTRAVELSPWNQDYIMKLANMYARDGDYGQAMTYYNRVLSLDSDYLGAYYALATLYSRAGNLSTAYAVQKQLLQKLKEDDVLSKERNKQPLYFDIDYPDGIQVSLLDYQAKSCYALYSGALTSYLLGMRPTAERYVKNAEEICKEDESIVIDLMVNDIEILTSFHPTMATIAWTFRRVFLE